MNPMSPSLQDSALVSDLELKSPSPTRLLGPSPNPPQKGVLLFLGSPNHSPVLHTHKSLHAPSLCAGSSPNSAPGRPLLEAFLYSITSLHCLPATHNTPAFVSQANLRVPGESEVTDILKSPGHP